MSEKITRKGDRAIVMPTKDGATIFNPERFYGRPKVRQRIGEGTARWWERLTDGTLAVACHDGDIVTAPVPQADLTAPIPDRSPNPERITCALDFCGMYGPEVDEALGVATPDDHVVDAWEDGTLVPTHEQIRRLATLTGRPVAFFFAGSIAPVGHVFICPPPELTHPMADLEHENAVLRAEIERLRGAGGKDHT